MIEFVALGGAIDPRGGKPPFGLSSYALIDRNAGWAFVTDFGLSQTAKIHEESEKILSLEIPKKEPEYEEIAGEKWPVLPDLNLEELIERVESFFVSGPGAHYLPASDILRGIPRLYLLVTHAHLDHCGAVPYFKNQFPHAVVMMTETTKELASWIWTNTLKLMEGRGGIPLFTRRDVDTLKRETLLLKENVPATFPDFMLTLFEAGHIPGAVGALLTIEGPPRFQAFFTGDTSFDDQYTVRGAPRLQASDLGDINCLVTETTYAHRESLPRETREELLLKDARSCLERGGKLLFPALSIGRAQEILATLTARGITNKWPVYLDGAACEITEIYARKGILPYGVLERCIRGPAERESILKSETPLVVIAPSGMLTGGRAVQYAVEWAENPSHMIAFTSYQHPSSPGYELLRVRRGQEVKFGGRRLLVRAEIVREQFSTHQDRNDLLAMLERLKPTITFLVHGEDSGMETIKKQSNHPMYKAFLGERYEL